MKKRLAKFFLKIGTIFAKDAYCEDNQLQKLKEMACVEEGHLWTTYKDPNKKIKERVYCRRCGQLYHEHEYIGKYDN